MVTVAALSGPLTGEPIQCPGSDQLLGIAPATTKAKPGTRLQREVQQIEKLNPKARRQITQVIDTFFEAQQIKQNVGRV